MGDESVAHPWLRGDRKEFRRSLGKFTIGNVVAGTAVAVLGYLDGTPEPSLFGWAMIWVGGGIVAFSLFYWWRNWRDSLKP